MPVERHADLPGPRKGSWVVDGGLVLERVGAAERVALDHVQRVAVKIAGAVEPGLIVEADHIHHQRVAFPVAVRPSHPAIGRAGPGSPIYDVARGVRVFIGDHDGLGRLQNLKRVRHVGGARHAGQVALGFGIELQTVRVICFLDFAAAGQVGDFVAFDHADVREECAPIAPSGTRGLAGPRGPADPSWRCSWPARCRSGWACRRQSVVLGSLCLALLPAA